MNVAFRHWFICFIGSMRHLGSVVMGYSFSDEPQVYVVYVRVHLKVIVICIYCFDFLPRVDRSPGNRGSGSLGWIVLSAEGLLVGRHPGDSQVPGSGSRRGSSSGNWEAACGTGGTHKRHAIDWEEEECGFSFHLQKLKELIKEILRVALFISIEHV